MTSKGRRAGKITKSKKPSPPRASKSLPSPLKAADVFAPCPTTSFKFKDTSELGQSHDIIAQNRAVRAINMGLGIRKPGYNIYVAGMQGTGKASVIRTFLERWSHDAKPPGDVVYIYDFDTPEAPRAILMAQGEGRKLKKKMEHLVKTLKEEIPEALQSEDYENAVNAMVSASNDKKSRLFSELEKFAKGMEFTIKSTRMGIETIPIVDGRQLTEKDYGKLDDAQREHIEQRRAKLEPEVLDFARKVRAIESETKEHIENLRHELGLEIVGRQIEAIENDFREEPPVLDYLRGVREDILENLLTFVEANDEDDGAEQDPMALPAERDKFKKYSVNIFVDNTAIKGAPVIIETNPTYYNLFGKIEKNVEHGMYLTDFTMIKAGSVHKANGGYLVLNALDIFRTPAIWETLKRVLKNRLGFIEDMGEQYSLLPTSGLRPQPIPLDLKVILIGSDDVYRALFDYDEDFHKIFKIKADFDYKMPRDPANVDAYVAFIATRGHLEKLLPFDRGAVAAVVEFGSRRVEDQRLLSTQWGELKDLTIEADFIARERSRTAVKREDVEEAIHQKFYRVNLSEEHLFEMVENKDLLISVDGTRVGQVNGLAVYDLGDYSFGKVGRITCTVSAADEGIVNIERMSKLSGKIHDKGIHVLSGFLSTLLARHNKLGVAASVCFEQSYGVIDGDSASVAEVVAIVSALSGTSVQQGFAVTGSVNQFGEVQPIGGVNEKVEGFLKTCRLIGKGKSYGVLVPVQNVPNLMLLKEAREAVQSGFLRVYPIAHVCEAFEIMTGRAFGVRDIHDSPAPGSAIAATLESLEAARQAAKKAKIAPAADAKKPVARPPRKTPEKSLE